MISQPSNALPPLALYIHLPWCVRKCPYCDFNSHRAGDDAPKDRYVEAVLKDIQAEAASGRAAGRPLQSIFIGGGTPSLFSAAEIGRLLQAAERAFSFIPDAEITMEANPGTVEYQNLIDYRVAGVSRLSIGAQSFDESMLGALGRIHGPGEIVTAFRGAEAAGFASINLDLMFALPGQSTVMAEDDLAQALELSPSHISWYQLTLEPNTVFYARPPENMPDDDTSWEMQQAGHDRLVDAGYEHYEVSAFAKKGHHCRHNLNYWTFGDYLAVGAGAHGKWTDCNGAVSRYSKTANPAGYMEQVESARADTKSAPLSSGEIAFEFMLNALRLHEGFGEEDFTARTGLPIGAIVKPLRQAENDGLMSKSEEGRWWATALGQRFLNDLQARFLDPE